MKQNLTNTMVCWNDKSAVVALVPCPDVAGISDAYDYTWGACDRYIQIDSFENRTSAVFINAVQMIVRDGCDPLAVHKALLGLEEYRSGCACDMPGIVDAMRKHGEDVTNSFDMIFTKTE